jgi:DNA-binding transcriptional regulator LsrR (DeoR family)
MASARSTPSRDPCSEPELLAVRAAWLYYVEGLTQAQVARAMNATRARVIGWLSAAREAGVVQVRIVARGHHQVVLEKELAERYRLREAVVIPSPSSDDHAAVVVGHAAGCYLAERLRPGLSVGVGWGATLQMALKAIGAQPVERLAVVSLLGGTTHSQAMTPPAVARRMADAFGADCYQLTAPLVVADEAMRDTLWSEPALRDLRERARCVDIALVSVGDLAETATLFQGDLLPPGQIGGLRAAGAVGDVLCHFLDVQGRVVDHPLNRRMMAVSLDDLQRVPRVVVASGGRGKVQALRAAMQALPVAVLITDETAARGLLDD